MYKFPLLLLLCLTCFSSNSLSQETLCKTDESPVFSCKVSRKKIASLCATNNLTGRSGNLYYRFGTKYHVDMTFPENKNHPSKNFVIGGWALAGGGGDFVSFTQGSYTYMVYSEFAVSHPDDGEATGWMREGVAVRKDGKFISNLLCKENALTPNGWSIVYKANLPVDDDRSQEPP